MSNEKQRSVRFGAGDERRLLVTVVSAASAVALTAFILKATLGDNTWFHDFFFRRSFVQWILLFAFALGLFHLLFRRIPAWLQERRALRSIQIDGDLPSSDTDSMVARRLRQLRSPTSGQAVKNPSLLAKHLAEHDEAELDAAYRVSGDIVQILPLIGFFGTVFGLSMGLYASFLGEGGATTKAFAKAIAIAFDNTLLGLALTVILFAIQSMLRKREDAILLHLNLVANDIVAGQQPSEDSVETTFDKSAKSLVERFDKLQKLLEAPSNELKELARTYTAEIATTVANKMSNEQKTNYEKLNQVASDHLKEQAAKLVAVVTEKTSSFLAADAPVWTEVTSIKKRLEEIAKSATDILSGIAALPTKEQHPQLQALTASIKELVTALGNRDSQMLDHLSVIQQVKGDVAILASNTHSLADQVSGLSTKIDALPEERRHIQELASSIKELAVALSQRDSLMLENLKEYINAHSHDLKSETAKLINRPRTLTILETSGDGSHDGEAKKI